MRRVLGLLFCTYVVAMSVLLVGFVRDFRNDGTLYYAAIQAEPNHAHGYFSVGSALLHRKNAPAALEYLWKAYRLQPFEHKHRNALGLALIRTDQNTRAVGLAESWLKHASAVQAADYLYLIALALVVDDPDRSVAASFACLRARPDWTRCQKQIADNLERFGPSSVYAEQVREQLFLPQNAGLREVVSPAKMP